MLSPKQTDISDDRLSDKVEQSSRQTKDKVETPLDDNDDDDVQGDDDDIEDDDNGNLNKYDNDQDIKCPETIFLANKR